MNNEAYIIAIIKELFRDPIKAQEIRTSTLEILKERPGSASRIFDKLPSLLPQAAMQDLAKKCISILSSMQTTTITYSDNGIQVSNPTDQENIRLFIKNDLASLAIKELLDEQCHMKSELIQLMGWDNFKNKLGRTELTVSILCGYIGAISQEIASKFSNEILKYGDSYAAFTCYINKLDKNCIQSHLRQWVKEELDKADPSAQGNLHFRNHISTAWSYKLPSTGSLMVLDAVTSTSSVSFFKKNNMPTTLNTLERTKLFSNVSS